MQIDEKKLARQELGVEKWLNNNRQGIFDWHTGVGKTFGAELCIKANEKIERDTYVITVASATLELQWKSKLNHLPKHLLDRIVIKSAQTLLSEDIVYEVGTLIIDELHEFTTEERLKLIDSTLIKCKRFLGLTASGDDKNFRKITKFYSIIDVITAEEAKAEGYVAEFIEYNLAVSLTDNEKITYDKLTETISKNMPKFDNTLSMAQKILVGGKHDNGTYYSGAGWALGWAIKKGWHRELNLSFESHKQIDDLWNPGVIIGYARALMNAIRGRKDFLCNVNAKYTTTLELVTKFNKVKTIIFSESTDFADKIGIILNENKNPTVVYHSNLKTRIVTSEKSGKLIKQGKTRLKNEALASIKSGKSRILATAKSLDRGLDIEDLRFSITASGSQNPTQYKQRNGRTGRKEKGIYADVPVLLVNIYVKDSQDEKWLANRQSNNKHEPIVVSSVEDISYTPAPNKEFTINNI
jgi:superfamily II DNA or RNA helicase